MLCTSQTSAKSLGSFQKTFQHFKKYHSVVTKIQIISFGFLEVLLDIFSGLKNLGGENIMFSPSVNRTVSKYKMICALTSIYLVSTHL